MRFEMSIKSGHLLSASGSLSAWISGNGGAPGLVHTRLSVKQLLEVKKTHRDWHIYGQLGCGHLGQGTLSTWLGSNEV
jgi:hypothetical protein